MGKKKKKAAQDPRSKRPNICLCMIVKNESKDIERCLESVVPYIDYWVISDTGSEDNTKELIQKFMDDRGIPGELHDHEWVDFSTNRNYALEIAKTKADFVWNMDADDNYVPPKENSENPFWCMTTEQSKDFDLFHFQYIINDVTMFSRAGMIRSKPTGRKIHYEGVLHEAMMYEGGDMVPPSKRLNMSPYGHIVARSSPLKRRATEKEKYLHDAEVLIKGLEKEPENTRYMFYLAQSYHLAHEYEKAQEWYRKRAEHKDVGNRDEIFLCYYEISKLNLALKKPDEVFIDSCIKAYEEQPSRIEPIYNAMTYLLNRGRMGYALALGWLAQKTVDPKAHIAKIELDVYNWKFPCQFARAMFFCNQKEAAIESLVRLLDRYKEDPNVNKNDIVEVETVLLTLQSKMEDE